MAERSNLPIGNKRLAPGIRIPDGLVGYTNEVVEGIDDDLDQYEGGADFETPDTTTDETQSLVTPLILSVAQATRTSILGRVVDVVFEVDNGDQPVEKFEVQITKA